jgi:hypothetical protein
VAEVIKKKRYSDSQLLSLTRDDGFQKIIGSDKELDRLSAIPRRSNDDLLIEIGLSFGGYATLSKDISVKPPTAGTFLLLSTIKSPYIFSERRKLIDVDIALYILNLGKEGIKDIDLTENGIQMAACGLCDKLSLDRVEVDSTILEMICACFRASEIIPRTSSRVDRGTAFDLPWYAWITSTVAKTTSLSADYVGWEMPLSLAMHYIVAEKRREGMKVIDTTPKELMLERMHQLMDEQIAKKGYL